MIDAAPKATDSVLHADVVIVGGGPAGTTVGTLLRKYNPSLSVLIIEKEKFPREHIGESQLPGISMILDEMGVWEKVEAANFPIKLGATFTWGRNNDVWDFDFYPAEEYVDQPRPGRFEGQRTFTAFQVERAIYDKILLDHAAEMGVDVRQQTQVRQVVTDGDRIERLVLDNGAAVTGRWFVDASGHVGLLRRALGIESDAPEELRNIAFWDYYDDAEWAVRIGSGGTRIQVRSLPYGWIWFIPIGPTRASVGLVCPSSYYKQLGLTPAEMHARALDEQPEIRHLLRNATSSTGGQILSTKNWSHLAERLAGENWFICGEAAGFADPILSAGMTLAHTSAREVAYAINEIERDGEDPAWIKSWYDKKNRRNIDQHIRFAKYWYAANSCFTDLKEHCQKIASDAGIRLNPSQAWRWLAQGGFANQNIQSAGMGSFDIASTKTLLERFHGGKARFTVTQFNEFELNLRNATQTHIAVPANGRITRIPCYMRGESILPLTGQWSAMVDILRVESDIERIYQRLARAASGVPAGGLAMVVSEYIQILEVMLTDGWVTGKLNKRRPVMTMQLGGRTIRSSEEFKAAAEHAKSAIVFNLPDAAPSAAPEPM